jgi:hypothetical protein
MAKTEVAEVVAMLMLTGHSVVAVLVMVAEGQMARIQMVMSWQY